METTIAIVGMIVVFGLFMAIVGWGYWYTRGSRESFPQIKD
jgi:hypothetical protein